jgi:hypothetical protein
MGYTGAPDNFAYVFANSNEDDLDYAAIYSIPLDSWVRDEYWYVIGSAGVANGTVQTWRNQKLESNFVGNRMTRGSSDGPSVRDVYLPYFAQGAAVDIHVDNVYIDNTRARVELCTTATLTSGRCDIQIPSAWSDSSVTISINQGNFAAGSTGYLYVIDASGTANATGLPVRVGGNDSLAPAAPRNLKAT